MSALVKVRCPRCGKELRILAGSKAWCPHKAVRHRELRHVLMMQVVEQDA